MLSVPASSMPLTLHPMILDLTCWNSGPAGFNRHLVDFAHYIVSNLNNARAQMLYPSIFTTKGLCQIQVIPANGQSFENLELTAPFTPLLLSDSGHQLRINYPCMQSTAFTSELGAARQWLTSRGSLSRQISLLPHPELSGLRHALAI